MLTLDRGSYKSTGGDILPNDVITKINGEDLYGPRKTVEFKGKDAGFILKDLTVVVVEDGKQAQSNSILVGMVVCEFDGQFVTSDKHFNELMESTTGSDVTYRITFDNVSADVEPKTLETFITEFQHIIANDVITKINKEDLYEGAKTVEFEVKDTGFML